MCDSKTLAVIPARGGSKGLSKKCLREVGGLSLLARAVLAAKKAKSVDEVLVSTDDMEFAQIALDNGASVPTLRSPELSSDNVSIIDVLIDILRESEHSGVNPDYLLLLQPTSPLREPEDIDNAFELLLKPDVEAVTSVCHTEVKPDWLRKSDAQGYLTPFANLETPQHTPRQHMPETFRLNGAIYWCRTEVLREKKTLLPQKTLPFIMPQERSVDIDSELDVKLANFMLECLTNKFSENS